jgi:hypothetical protein
MGFVALTATGIVVNAAAASAAPGQTLPDRESVMSIAARFDKGVPTAADEVFVQQYPEIGNLLPDT